MTWQKYLSNPLASSNPTSPNLKRYHSLKQLGIDMLNWHGSMGDPIYAVGSFYINDQPYPDRSVVVRARDGLSSMIPGADARAHGWTAKDARELRSMVRALDNILSKSTSSKRRARCGCAEDEACDECRSRGKKW